MGIGRRLVRQIEIPKPNQLLNYSTNKLILVVEWRL